ALLTELAGRDTSDRLVIVSIAHRAAIGPDLGDSRIAICPTESLVGGDSHRATRRLGDGDAEAEDLIGEDRGDLQAPAEGLDVVPEGREVDVLLVLDPRHIRLRDPERAGNLDLGGVARLAR